MNTDAGMGLLAAAATAGAFYAVFAAVRSATERSLAEGVAPPRWTRYALLASILGFLVVAIAVALLAPTLFGGVILGGCVGVTIAFQVRRPRRPLPPRRPGPPSSEPPVD